MPTDLLTLQANGTAVRYFYGEDGSPFLCGRDVIAATGLAGKLNITKLSRWLGDWAVRRVNRRDHPNTFGTRGRPDILFFHFDALESWARGFPDGTADRLMRGLRMVHFRPFSPAD